MSDLDETIERLCEVYCQYRFASPSGFIRYVDQSPSDKDGIRAGVRAVREAVLAEVRPMPDRLEVANAVREAYTLPPLPTWEDMALNVQREAEAILKLFTGRTDADYERLKDENANLYTVIDKDNKIAAQRDEARAERDALAAELEALKSTTPEPTDDEVERLCKVFCEGRINSDANWEPMSLLPESYVDGLRAGIRAVARELPRLPYQPPEGVTRQSLRRFVDTAPGGEEAHYALRHLGITLPEEEQTITLNGPQTAKQLRAAAEALEANA